MLVIVGHSTGDVARASITNEPSEGDSNGTTVQVRVYSEFCLRFLLQSAEPAQLESHAKEHNTPENAVARSCAPTLELRRLVDRLWVQLPSSCTSLDKVERGFRFQFARSQAPLGNIHRRNTGHVWSIKRYHQCDGGNVIRYSRRVTVSPCCPGATCD